MTELGLLYEKLIVDTRDKHSTYYHHVQEVIEEMRKDLPMPCRTKDMMAYYHYSDTESWLRKWFGDRAEAERDDDIHPDLAGIILESDNDPAATEEEKEVVRKFASEVSKVMTGFDDLMTEMKEDGK